MTFSNYDQGFTDFQLQGLDDGERRDMLQRDFDQHLQVAATQHYQSDVLPPFDCWVFLGLVEIATTSTTPSQY